MSDKKKKDIPGQEPEAETSVPAAENAENPAAENAANPAEETIPETFTVTREQMEKMEGLAKLVADVNDKYLRLAAEYDNYRKRTANEKTETYQNASVQCVEKLLPVLDSFERSLEAECSDEHFKNGMALIYNQLKNFLTQMNVTEIEALGAEFDPNVHNAIQQQDGTDYESNHICSVFQKGYMLGDKLVRPAMVAVAV